MKRSASDGGCKALSWQGSRVSQPVEARALQRGHGTAECAARDGRGAGELCCVSVRAGQRADRVAGWALRWRASYLSRLHAANARCARPAHLLRGLVMHCWRTGLSVGADITGDVTAGSVRGLAAAAVLWEGLHGRLPCTLLTALLRRGAAGSARRMRPALQASGRARCMSQRGSAAEMGCERQGLRTHGHGPERRGHASSGATRLSRPGSAVRSAGVCNQGWRWRPRCARTHCAFGGGAPQGMAAGPGGCAGGGRMRTVSSCKT